MLDSTQNEVGLGYWSGGEDYSLITDPSGERERQQRDGCPRRACDRCGPYAF